MSKEQKYLSINDIRAYRKAFELSNKVWKIIEHWEYFPKSTVGSQLARSIDSISANIAEGFGRYSRKDKVRFYIIARGSVIECLDWIEKAKERELLKRVDYDYIFDELNMLPKEINWLIKYTNKKLKV